MSDNTPNHSRFFWRTSALFCLLDQAGNFLEINSAWEKKLELSTGQLLAKPFLDFVHEDDRETARTHMKRLSSGTVATSFTARFRHYSSGHRAILWEMTAAASQEIGIYAVGLEVSEKEKADTQEEIISVLNDGVVLQYANGTIGACNASAERILGMTADQMFVWTLIDPDWPAIHDDGSPFPVETHPAICTLRTGQPYTDVIIGIERPDGSKLWLRLNTHPIWRDDVTTPYAVVISFSDITPFKTTEQSLRTTSEAPESEMMAHFGGDNFDLWEWIPETGVMTFSAQWKKMFGYDPEELPDHINTWLERIHPLDYQRVKSELDDHLRATKSLFESTHRIQHKDGGYRRMLCRGMAIRDASGKPSRVIGMHVDTTEVRDTDESAQQDGKYQQLADMESAAVFVVDAESGQIAEANKAATQLYGYSRKEFLSMNRWELSAQAEKFRKTGRKQQYTRLRHHKRKDGGVFPVEMTLKPVVHHGQDMEMLLIRDITEKQEIETALWESQSKYRQLFEASSSAIIVFDPNTQHIFDVNNVAVNLYGFTKDEFAHLTTEDLSAETVRARATLTPSGKRINLIPLRWHKKKDGVVFPVEISIGSTYLFQGRSLVCATIKDITERRAAEEALRKEKEFIHTLVQASPAYFYAINPNGKIRMMNRSMLETLGYEHDEVVEQDYLRFIPIEEQAMAGAEFDALIKSLRPSVMESHMLAKDGRTVLVEWHSRALVQADGSLDYLLSVGIDVTERTEAQGNLRLFKSIIQASEEAIAISDPDGNLVYINPAHEKLFGFPLDEVQGKQRDYYPPESREVIQNEVLPNLKRGESWAGEMDVLDADGTRFPIWERSDAVRDNSGKILYFFELMHNISERQRMWDTLRTQWEEYQTLFNNIPVMIWYRDRENRLMRANHQASTLLNLDREPAKFYADNMAVMRAGEALVDVLVHYPDLHGGMRWLKTGRFPYRGKDGEIIGVTIFAMDVSEYKHLEQQRGEVHARVRQLLMSLPMIVIGYDGEGRVVDWNAEAERVTGYKAEEVTGRAEFLQTFVPDEAQRQPMNNPQQDFLYQEIVVRCKDGSGKSILWSQICGQFPVSAWHHWHLGEDLSKRSGSGKERLMLEEMLVQIFLGSTLAICITDDRGRYLRVNAAYARLFGYEPEELLGQPFTLVLPEKNHEEAIREYFGTSINHPKPFAVRAPGLTRLRDRTFEVEGISERLVLDDGRRMLLTILTKAS